MDRHLKLFSHALDTGIRLEIPVSAFRSFHHFPVPPKYATRPLRPRQVFQLYKNKTTTFTGTCN